MKESNSWQYNEFTQVGKDYSKKEEASQYEGRHSDFRNIEDESKVVLDALNIKKTDVVIDFGCGTGIFALLAAYRCQSVYAVDVSEAMLAEAKGKAKAAGVSNITFCHGGFLTFQPENFQGDVITTTFAFHHLPDFWKGIALERLFSLLKPGGRLFIHDVVLEEKKVMENIEGFIKRLTKAGGANMREDVESHFREEFSTFDWIMDGLLTRSGFEIDQKYMQDGVIATYYCTRKPLW